MTSAECIERACEAARMGVSTGLIVGDKVERQTTAAMLGTMAADAKVVPSLSPRIESVLIWAFGSGGELILASNVTAAKTVYLRRHRSGEPLEIVYLGRGSVG